MIGGRCPMPRDIGRKIQSGWATTNHNGYFVYGTRCLTIRQTVRGIGDSMLGSLRPVAAQASFCAPCTAGAVVLALIVSSPVNAAEYRYTDYGPHRYDSVPSFTD